MTDEVLQRVKRIETRLMRMAEMMGLDPSNKVRASYNKEDNSVEIGGMDVSMANLLDIVRREGIRNAVHLTVGGESIGVFVPAKDHK